MDTIKCRSIPGNKSSKIAKTFQKVINLKSATKIASNNGIGICMLNPQNKFDDEDLQKPETKSKDHAKAKRKAVLEALIAKIFAGVTTIKAAYAEMQMAQNPYCSDAIQEADQAIVQELKQLSELKRSFLKNELDHLSPQVTVMLAEIQEQQSLMKTYAIMIKKIEGEVGVKDSEISLLKKRLDESISVNKSIEKSLNASGPLSMFDHIQFSTLCPTHFVQFLHCVVRSIRSFVKLMVRDMESANWNIDEAAKAIEPKAVIAKPSHRCFVFESFVSKTILEGFEDSNFSIKNESCSFNETQFFKEFKKYKSVNTKPFLNQNPNSPFARFIRTKYFQLVHAKMECSLFGNLNQRKLLSSGNGFPDSGFFNAFSEMARRVWALHCLAFSFGEEVGIFQVRKNCRFSEVYMESVTDELLPEEIGDLRVSFTVVPGFKIGKNVIQTQVYLSPVSS